MLIIPWSQVRTNFRVIASLAIIGFFVLIAIAGPVVLTRDPLTQDLSKALLGFSSEHPLGTDPLGRDILSRMIYGTRLSLIIALVVTLSSAALGVSIGLVTGYTGGAVDLLLMRVIDTMIAFPGLLLALTVISVLGPGLENMMLAIVIYTIPVFVRVSRGVTLRVKSAGYVEAAKALGCAPSHILLHHILPNSISSIVVQLTIEMGAVLLMSSGLSFLGLGVQRPTPEWGLMLSDGRQYLRTAPHVPLVPGLAIMVIVLGFNLLGDGLRDLLDPTLQTNGRGSQEGARSRRLPKQVRELTQPHSQS